MAKYFKIIGYLFLVSFLIASFTFFLELIKSTSNSFLESILFICFILIGPALGLLFISYGDMLEKKDSLEKRDFKSNYKNYINESTISSQTPIIKDGSEYMYNEVEIAGGSMKVGGNTYNIKYITEVKKCGQEVVFNFYNKRIKILCESESNALVIYHTLISNMNGLNKKENTCAICGDVFFGYENNPWPIKDNGVCCSECYRNKVIPTKNTNYNK